MDEAVLKTYLAERVRAFGEKWNLIENDIHTQSREEDSALREQYPGIEYHYAPRTNWFAPFGERTSPLFDEFCTDKRRVYGGKNPKSFGFPSKFNGIEDPLEVNVEIKTKSRAEVYVKTQSQFKDEYLFIMLKKAGEWRIDSYKNRRYGNEKWSSSIL
ncbi:hypothetical protein SOASR030_32470 [Leminorella grimontii]|uniref:NTF2 fold immunity protein domain-containing protein n=1 Tax=Leminorella grimontii TaxID=82981 RepID=A0AAV5N4T6_9GAMM|nr:NTF2 fold immunity protein [Leminorella grimontii]KFC92641.1 hypothetical protein GLGR_3750 [Leminorella grimontii ATCC 33999 = DSM 5078]GKX57135.1 hypothetical protein SOASR030_32470 [Leminorella grimontii]VFS62623.1 Uncharacterised protein [Leminorella grimontii]